MNRTYTVPTPGEKWHYRQIEGYALFMSLLTIADRRLNPGQPFGKAGPNLTKLIAKEESQP